MLISPACLCSPFGSLTVFFWCELISRRLSTSISPCTFRFLFNSAVGISVYANKYFRAFRRTTFRPKFNALACKSEAKTKKPSAKITEGFISFGTQNPFSYSAVNKGGLLPDSRGLSGPSTFKSMEPSLIPTCTTPPFANFPNSSSSASGFLMYS